LNTQTVDVSVVIPVRDDAIALSRLLTQLRGLSPCALELIVVDGHSSDESARVAREAKAIVIETEAGRGRQLAAGVARAQGEWIWMLHADSGVTRAQLTLIRSQRVPGWGRFDVRFEPGIPGMVVVATLMNWRSRLTGICTGDQGLFAHRRLLELAGGVPTQSLMEDIELSSRLKRLCRPVCSRVSLVASSRRWRRDGVLRTVVSMWRLRLRYWWGADAELLAREYYG